MYGKGSALKKYTLSICDCPGPYVRVMRAVVSTDSRIIKSLTTIDEEVVITIELNPELKAVFEIIAKTKLIEV